MDRWSVSVHFGDEDGYTSESAEDSDDGTSYASILQSLINRYTYVHPRSSTPRNSNRNGSAIPEHIMAPNTTNIEKSEFALATQVDSGRGVLKRRWSRNNITNMLVGRQNGVPLSSSFSNADRCALNSMYFPNEMKILHLQRHRRKVFCGVFSKEGDCFVTAGQDHRITLYDTRSALYKELNEIRARLVDWAIIDVTFSPNSEHLVYTTWKPILYLCSTHTDKQESLYLTTANNRFCAFAVVFSPSGEEVLTAANDGCIYIYDLAKRKRTSRIAAHDFDVNSIAFSTESSQIIYSGGDDGLIKVWDRRTLNEGAPKPVGILAGHVEGVTYIDSRGDGRHLISNSKDQSIKLWDIRVFSSQKAAENAIQLVQEQEWDYRWQEVPAKLYHDKIAGDTSLMTYRGHAVTKSLIRCRFSPAATTGQRYIYTGCGLGRVIIYDALTGVIKNQLIGHKSTVRDVSWHPYRNEILSSSWDGLVCRWRYSSNESGINDEEPSSTKVMPQSIRRSARLALKRLRQQ